MANSDFFDRGWHYVALFVALVAVILIFTSCVTQERCLKRFPPEVKDSTYYSEQAKDTSKVVPADSAQTKYLIECEKVAEGYRVRIVQLLGQQAGNHSQAPTAVIHDTILTVRSFTPEYIDRWTVKVISRGHFVEKRHTILVNYLTGWQWFQIWCGRVLWGLALILIARGLIRKYTGLKV